VTCPFVDYSDYIFFITLFWETGCYIYRFAWSLVKLWFRSVGTLSLLCFICWWIYVEIIVRCVRFLDIYWLLFVKTLVLARCQTWYLNLLVRHHSVSCFSYLEIHFKSEDFQIFSEDLFHVKSWPIKRVSRSRGRRFMLNMFLKNVVAIFKETFDMLQNTCAEISWFRWFV